MAAGSPGQDVKDPGYRNWLKVGQALLYMKRAFHSFVRNEVNLIHKYLIYTIYGGTTVLYPKCTRCKASDIKQHKRTKVWGFITAHCPALCHDWLTELLNLFDNPRSDRIYWSNCDVTCWAYNPWECAKAFMPRGQKSTNTDPNESDAQALLTLMANCKHFHRFFSPTGISQIHKVSDVRNTIMHAPQMKLTDAEMRSCIQEIINLLEDPVHLHSLPDCIAAVSDIKKIRDASVDVFLDLELDIKALRELHEEAIEKLQNDLHELCQDTDSSKSDLRGLHQQMDSQKSDLQGLHQYLDLQKLQLQGLSHDTESHKSDLRELQQDLDLQKSYLQGLHEDMDLQRSDLQGLHQDMDLQKSDLRELQQDMSEVKVRTASERQPTEKDVREIELLLIKAYERVHIISISPVLDSAVNLKGLDEFYTDIVIEENKEESTRKRKDEEQADKEKVNSFKSIIYQCEEQKYNQEKVLSFRQIFKTNNKATRIILKAPACQGKSTFCRKLVHTWCSVQKKKLNPCIDEKIPNTSERNGLNDEDEMLRFDVLLYICLRDISDEKTLMDAIYTQFPLHESQHLSHRSHIEAMIGQAEDNKVLLIMDGLDEMVNSSSFVEKIMQRSLYAHLTVLATTRPWKIDQLSLIRSAHIDLLLDLQGFSYENSMLFAKRIFNKYYRDESAIAQFKKDIWSNKLIASLIHVPLLLLFIVHVWYEKKSFPQKIHKLYMEILNVMVNRYMKSKFRKQEDKKRENKKYVGLKTWSLESSTFILNPKLRKLSLVQHFGEEFLAALCEVADHFLITDAKETSLVFEEKALVKLFGKDGLSKLRIALDLGILSNSESPGIFRKTICVMFLHKTVQEFLAAINICCREDRCNIFLQSLNTLPDVFRSEKIIMFVSGISTSHCQNIFEKIYELCDKDVDLRRTYSYALNRLYWNYISEDGGEPISLKLHSLYAYKNEWNVLQSTLITSHVRNHLRCLAMQSCTLDDANLDLTEYTSLTELSLHTVNMKGNLLLSRCTQLKSLTLQNSSFEDSTLDLTECTSLTDICLHTVNMKGKLLLSRSTQLKSLTLQNSSFEDSTLDLTECTSLTDICLHTLNMKGKLLLSRCTQLKSLTLQNSSFEDSTLDLTECTSLTDICLHTLNMKGKLLLSRCTQLKSLTLQNSSFEDSTLDMTECTSLTDICLHTVNMKGKLLLSRCTQLKSLTLEDSSFEDSTLDLTECTSLTELRLHTVTRRGKLLLSKCSHLKCLTLQLSSDEDSTLDLTEFTSHTELRFNKVTIKGKLLLLRCTLCQRK